MIYRMKFLGYRNGKALWRGTGCNQQGVTLVDPQSVLLWVTCEGQFYVGGVHAQA